MFIVEMLKHIKPAFMMLAVFTVLTGFVYPLVVTGVAQLFFPWQANGSLIQKEGKIIGSALIGQNFTDLHYFWGRPSATVPFPYNAASSSGSNLGPLHPDLLVNVKKRIAQLHGTSSGNQALIPVDLVTASASGLDPEISQRAALYQVQRVAAARGLDVVTVEELVIKAGTLVNVLKLNRALDILRGK